ncbi:MAG: UbiA prenyltransferase family protein [Cyclobacteriaceae bacterium]|nr:UbiA prenyltransferase family protein [Cyclobacteriaceae bacterium]
MLAKSVLLHLRFPFSFFLLPVYLFALGVSPNFSEPRIIWSLLIIHFLLYPASNGYNSYFDKDEKSIGGLKNPPPVSKLLYYVSLLMDGLAIFLALKISVLFAIMLFIYGMVSKAYSHPMIRLKKYPIAGWLVIGLFQGFFTFLMSYEGINAFGFTGIMNSSVLTPALLSSVMLLGNYPMTQIYQHEEDGKRGDKTISIMLGIKGTFLFTAAFFALATGGFAWYFFAYHGAKYAWYFLSFLGPVVVFFFIWFFMVIKDETKADYQKTMILNFISSLCLNAFFIYFFLDSTQVIQAIKGGF